MVLYVLVIGKITEDQHFSKFQVGVDIQLGNSGLTKIVIFTPFYKILNKAPFDLEVMEAEFPHAEWFTVLSGKEVCISWNVFL